MSILVCNLNKYQESPDAVEDDLKKSLLGFNLKAPVLWCTGPKALVQMLHGVQLDIGPIVWISESAESLRDRAVRWAFLSYIGYPITTPIFDMYNSVEIPFADFIDAENAPNEFGRCIEKALKAGLSLPERQQKIEELASCLKERAEHSQHARAILGLLNDPRKYVGLHKTLMTSSNDMGKVHVIDMTSLANLNSLKNLLRRCAPDPSFFKSRFAKAYATLMFRIGLDANSVAINSDKGIKIRLLWWSFFFIQLSEFWRDSDHRLISLLFAFRALETWSFRVLWDDKKIFLNGEDHFVWGCGGRVSGGGEAIRAAIEGRTFRRFSKQVDISQETILVRQLIGFRNNSAVGHGYITPTKDDFNELYGSVRKLIKKFEHHHDLDDGWWEAQEGRIRNSEKIRVEKVIEEEWRKLFAEIC